MKVAGLLDLLVSATGMGRLETATRDLSMAPMVFFALSNALASTPQMSVQLTDQ